MRIRIIYGIVSNEYIPEEEITQDQSRQTIVTLYFANNQLDELKKEGRLIDIKELYLDPYNSLINMLIDGPTSSDMVRLIPEEAILIGSILEGNCLTIDWSSQILEGEDNNLMIKSILETLRQLIEIEEIKMTVEGKSTDWI
ncbi:MAG: GerMN domain-containing protein [Eubacteriales bacterium]